ncbi:hypothetical protein J6590_018053, partial [Homalodisca vitripennis]
VTHVAIDLDVNTTSVNGLLRYLCVRRPNLLQPCKDISIDDVNNSVNEACYATLHVVRRTLTCVT